MAAVVGATILMAALAAASASADEPLIATNPKLTNSQGKTELFGGSWFGESVAVSGDGTTAVVGAPHEGGLSQGVGGAWVFSRSGPGWASQSGRLLPSSLPEPETVGFSVAISADGNTLVLGNPSTSPSAHGSATVFVRSGSSWTEQAELRAASGVKDQRFGWDVALSGDGSTAVVGSLESTEGSATVFTRSGTAWTRQTTLQSAGRGFGSAVASSSDGGTILVASEQENSTGAVRAYTRSGSEWLQQGPPLVGEGEGDVSSLALSADGNTAVVGGDGFETEGAWVFSRAGEAWTQQGSKLEPSDGSPGVFAGPGFGRSVAVSGDGDTALIAGSADGRGTGATWVFTRAAETWSQQGTKITGRGEVGEGFFGVAVALSEDGGTGLVGAFNDGTGAGAVWTLSRVSLEAGGPPVEASPPRILGIPTQGQPLEEEHGSWGGEPVSYSLQWLRCDASGANCHEIEGAAGAAYTPGEGDVGSTLRVEETATNSSSTSAPAVSSASAAVRAPFGPEFGHCVSAPAGTGKFGNSKCSALGGKQNREWVSGVAKPGFTLTGGAATVEVEILRRNVSCSASTGTGSYTTSKRFQATITFTGCSSGGSTCASEGAAAGHIVTDTLVGRLVRLKASKKVAFDLEGAAGVIARFGCGPYPVEEIQGGVLLPVKAYTGSATLKAKESKGVQKTSPYVGDQGETLTAQLSWDGFGELWRPAGLATSLVLAGEEPIEINTSV